MDPGRIAIDRPALSDDLMRRLEPIAARSISPVVVSALHHHSLQLHGHFDVGRTTEARQQFAHAVLGCLGRTDELEIRASEPAEKPDLGRRGSQRFELFFHGVPVYRGGISLAAGDDGIVKSAVVALPRTSPLQAKWGDEGIAERMLRDKWGLGEVGAPWLLRRGRRMWYAASLVHGSIDAESWQPAWVFSSDGAVENPFDVVVSGDGVAVVDTVVVGHEAGLAPLPRYHVRPATGVPDFITWGQIGLLLPEAGSGDPQRTARALFDRYPKLFGTADSPRQLTVLRTDVSSGSPRTRHVVFQQMLGTVPVYGCQLRVHLSPALAIRSVSGTYLRDPQVSLEVKVSEAQAISRLALEAASGHERQRVSAGKMTSRGLVVFPSVLAPGGGAINHLAWWIVIPKWHYFVSAESGRIVYRITAEQETRLTYDANQATSGETLDVRDGMVVASGGSPDVDSVSTDATVASFETFLLSLFGWRSWDDHGSDDISVVDYPEANAFWSNDDHRVRFGRNFTTSEIIGHEFTHGIVEATAGLQEVGEPGALNESFADVIGKLAFPGSPPDWISRHNDGTSIRNLADPIIGRYSLLSNFPVDHFSVHSNCGIGNRCAVLVCDGSIPDARPGIGRELTTRLWWDVMTLRLHPWASYLDFSHAMRETVRHLASMGTAGVAAPASAAAAGGPMPVFDPVAVGQVDWALDKVELSPALQSGWFTIPGSFEDTITFFPGASLPAGEVITSAEVLAIRERDADKTQFLFGRAIVPGAPKFVDQSGTLTVEITSHGVGTQSKQIVAKITNDGGVDVELSANVYMMAAAAPPATPSPIQWPSPYIAHWFDNPLFLGRKYGDIIYETVGVPASCSLLDVWLELLQDANGVLIPRGQARLGGPPAEFGGTGVMLVDAHPGTYDLEAKVRSWHDFGQIVRYRIVYVISGGCTPTAFGFREVDPFTFT
jgi:Zn-dependent metalloprotease